MTVLGAVFRPQVAPERLRDVARAADSAGLEQLWLWEDCFFESGIASAAAALAWTSDVRIGVGLLPVPLRNVALTAMEAATLYRMFGDRAILAFGHGVQRWMGQTGSRVESPLTLLREYLVALRGLLNGEEVSTDGRYVKLDKISLEWPPLSPPAIYAGAEGARSLKLCAEVADGTLLTASSSPERVREVRAYTKSEIVVYMSAATGPGAAERLRAEQTANEDLDKGLGAAGDAQAIADAVHRLVQAGADTVILQPTPDEPDPVGFVRFVAEEVRPLVR
ncbi:LLM class flavin-dependent oxidoreductase [Actinocrispum sp. NPDC049592]|uniref:LLM class flavin-dependent oxidoreductase n=1 Tax=Actinocrispum sp. NPDC049592 TaxID=3154835 RepID=UPI003449FC31